MTLDKYCCMGFASDITGELNGAPSWISEAGREWRKKEKEDGKGRETNLEGLDSLDAWEAFTAVTAGRCSDSRSLRAHTAVRAQS